MLISAKWEIVHIQSLSTAFIIEFLVEVGGVWTFSFSLTSQAIRSLCVVSEVHVSRSPISIGKSCKCDPDFDPNSSS